MSDARLIDESAWSWWCETCMEGRGPYYDTPDHSAHDMAKQHADAHNADPIHIAIKAEDEAQEEASE